MKNTFVLLTIILLALSLIAFAATFPLFYSAEYSDILAVLPVTFAALCPLCEAVKKGDLSEEIKKLLKEDVNHKCKEHLTVLMVAVIFGQCKVAKFLLENKADVNIPTNCGNTALILAANTGKSKSEMVQLLLEEKYEVDVNAMNIYGSTALMMAVNNRDKTIAKLLLKRNARVNDKNKCGRTALMTAAKNRDREMEELLQDFVMRQINSKNLNA